jgi:twitching motility protein PilT
MLNEPTKLIDEVISRDASDLHLVASYPPAIRQRTVLVQLSLYPVLTDEDILRFFLTFTNKEQQETFFLNKELDFSIVYKNFRFRANSYYQLGHPSISLRLIPEKIRTIEDLHLPSVFHRISEFRQGLVLITGQTSQGKSTTLASVINEINLTRQVHIVTIEDPIEFTYPKAKAIISQREVRHDTHSFSNALRSVLREDPDVIVIGEMRDFETISSALTLAETGHLVFSTLHTNTSSQTLDRIIDVFPEEQQSQIRIQLSSVLKSIVCQKLLPDLNEENLVPAVEILFNNSAIAALVREGKTFQIDNVLHTSASEEMIIFEQYLKQMVDKGIIRKETALRHAFRSKLIAELLK